MIKKELYLEHSFHTKLHGMVLLELNSYKDNKIKSIGTYMYSSIKGSIFNLLHTNFQKLQNIEGWIISVMTAHPSFHNHCFQDFLC